MIKDPKLILQARYNAEAVFRFYRLPDMEVAAALPDRTFFKRNPEFIATFPHLPFTAWDFNVLHGATAMRGWRENVATCSMQVVEHDSGLVEVDFDLFNPGYGVAPAVGHLIEWLWPGKTDPFRILRGLRKRGLNPVEA